jgi:hypothetical protein
MNERTNLLERAFQYANRGGYRFVLLYAAQHDAGQFRAWKREDFLTFCSEADAQMWVDGIARQYLRGKVNYRVTSFEVIDLSKKAA